MRDAILNALDHDLHSRVDHAAIEAPRLGAAHHVTRGVLDLPGAAIHGSRHAREMSLQIVARILHLA